ncbi:MAG: MerR family transcriptional regulator [Chloroflexi bacterium]|nr:MerR family transcriptional regulator [Anaerolineaceae bacterium]NMB90949.1 MerR family transcriptional regulator [Chloroflexota bacterium]
MPRHLSTSVIARAAGVHPNTVRLYETWGFLPPVPRSPAGYRLYTQFHLDQMCLARLALHGQWPGPAIRHSALQIVQYAARGDLHGARALAGSHLLLVQAELEQATMAVQALERWAAGDMPAEGAGPHLRIGDVSQRLNVSRDILRSWERNGLLEVPRQPGNHYRLYSGEELARLRIIRMLRQAGYSVMALLRMLRQLDQGRTEDLGQVLDTPDPDEDILSAADRWLTSLAEQEQRAVEIITRLDIMLAKSYD